MRHSSFLLILLLAFGQFAQALHQVEHVAAHSEADCQLSLHAQSAPPRPQQTPCEPLFRVVPAAAPVAAVASVPSLTSHAWLARAPPVLR